MTIAHLRPSGAAIAGALAAILTCSACRREAPHPAAAPPRTEAAVIQVAGAGFSATAGLGRGVVHCAGESALDVGTLRPKKGAATVLVVARSASTAAKPWQRLFVSWSGGGPDWVSPSFNIMRPNGASPTPFEPRIFLAEHADEVVLDNIRLANSTHGAQQGFIGDLAEVLVFDRLLRFDELLAIRDYLRAKWSLH